MCLCQTKLPRKTCIVDGALWCCSGTSIVSGDQDNGCSCLGNTGCNCSYTCFRNKLDGNSRIFITVLQIINELCQILDRVNIMMWRRRDQADTRCRMTSFGNPRINLSARKVATFTRLCTLCHLDLDLLCTDQITGGNTETSGSHLLDRRTAIHSRTCCFQSFQTLTTLTAV